MGFFWANKSTYVIFVWEEYLKIVNLLRLLLLLQQDNVFSLCLSALRFITRHFNGDYLFVQTISQKFAFETSFKLVFEIKLEQINACEHRLLILLSLLREDTRVIMMALSFKSLLSTRMYKTTLQSWIEHKCFFLPSTISELLVRTIITSEGAQKKLCI